MHLYVSSFSRAVEFESRTNLRMWIFTFQLKRRKFQWMKTYGSRTFPFVIRCLCHTLGMRLCVFFLSIRNIWCTFQSFAAPQCHLLHQQNTLRCVSFSLSIFSVLFSCVFAYFFFFDLVLIADIKHIPLHCILHHHSTRLITVWRFVAIHFIKLHNLNEANRKWRKYSVQLIVWLLNGPSDFLEMCFFSISISFSFSHSVLVFSVLFLMLMFVAVILTLNRHNFRKAGDFERIESCTAVNGWMYAMRSNVKMCDLNWNRHKMF